MERIDKTIHVTGCYRALESNCRDIVLLEGSTRSTKTWSILQYLVARCITEPVRIFAGRHDGTTCNDTIISDWRECVIEHWPDLWPRIKYNKQEKHAEFPSGAIWDFGGTSDHQKLHGRKQNICWLNELMEIDYEAYKQLDQRTSELIIGDWNPSLTHHWVFDRVMKDEGTYTYHHSTYLDNPFLTDRQRIRIEKSKPTPENMKNGTADEWFWKVYGLGVRAGKKGRIFKHYLVDDDWPERTLCQRWGYGLDFGFSQDPTALVECALFNDELHLRQRLYKKELIVGASVSQPKEESLEGLLNDLDLHPSAKIYADCAQPESIRALRLAGFSVLPSKKGKNSIVDGLNLMKQFRIHLHVASQDLQREFENYTWDRRADGTWLDVPIDDWNHLIDGARYWARSNLHPRVRALQGHGKKRKKKAKIAIGHY